jgi:DNA-binding beta-propeller fold protein YncE
VKSRTLVLCLLVFLPFCLNAENISIEAAQSSEQLRRGVQAFHRGFFNDSLASLEKAITLQPSNALAQTWLGRALWQSGFEREALKTWEQLVAAGKGSSLIRDWIQVLSLRRGLGRETPPEHTWAVSAELDGTRAGGYSFKRPTSVRPRRDGSFWVAAFGSNEVLLFDANFSLVSTFRGGLVGFDRPFDVLEAGDGTLFVSEYGANRVAVCSPRGDIVRSIGRSGRAEGRLLGPQYLAEDDRGYLWVTDWGNSRVARFDPAGNYVLSIPGVSGPTGIATQEGKVYVSERTRGRILVYDLSGNALATIGEGTLHAPEGLSFSGPGILLVADANRVMECDIEKETWTQRGDPSGHTKNLVHQAAGANGEILGADFDLSKVILLSDVSALYAGLFVKIQRVNSVKFPEVTVEVSVESRLGRPIVGLGINNFIVTESRYSVGETSLALSSVDVKNSDISLVIEASPLFNGHRAEAEKTVGDLYQIATQGGRLLAISAGERPAKETEFGETRLRFIAQSLRAEPSAKWRFDAAIRLAGDELIGSNSRAKRAIVFFTTGVLPAHAFRTYSISETAAYLRNNAIAFYPVAFGQKGLDEDLAFIASETGGKGYGVFSPGGMKEVVRDIRARIGSLYTIRYRSRSAAEFGEKYIPVEIETTLQRVSGRDESGYYAPLAP